jgi:hypothetical protein
MAELREDKPGQDCDEDRHDDRAGDAVLTPKSEPSVGSRLHQLQRLALRSCAGLEISRTTTAT